MKRFALYIIIFLTVFISCGKLKGQFAFKEPLDKSYKIGQERLEFDSSEEVKWLYKFNNFPGNRIRLGVIILKKELGWVDVLSMPDFIDEQKDVVYGAIKGLDPGDYKLVITEFEDNKTVIIDSCEFYIFSDEETLD